MARSAAVGGILLALIEGIGIMITRITAEQFKPGITKKILNPGIYETLPDKVKNFSKTYKIDCIFYKLFHLFLAIFHFLETLYMY